MNPFRTFRALRDIATRRPILVGIVGLGLLGEAGRVLDAIDLGEPVRIFGHLSSELWQASEEEQWLTAYAGWVGFCGMVLLWLAISGWRSPRPGGAAALRPSPPVRSETAKPNGSPRAVKAAASGAGGAVVWRRKVAEVRPNRLSR
ncbi:hypothetical protein [Pinisolibacter sp.]|uniref:hypothetical protein n=1 Tax=Pinisolibacter sp. TaxID=2172024 RepID=UPI002FDD1B19